MQSELEVSRQLRFVVLEMEAHLQFVPAQSIAERKRNSKRVSTGSISLGEIQ